MLKNGVMRFETLKIGIFCKDRHLKQKITLSKNIDLIFQNGRRETRLSQQQDPTDSPHPYLNQRRSCNSDNILTLSDIPPAPPAPRPIPKFTQAQIRLMRAVTVDKVSRVAFPLTFTILNCTYWYMFYEYI
jgi:hypothetical protein